MTLRPMARLSRLLTSSFSALFGGMNMTAAMLSDVVQVHLLPSALSLQTACCTNDMIPAC